MYGDLRYNGNRESTQEESVKVGTCSKCHRIELMISSNGYCRSCGAAYKKAQRLAGKVKVATACVKCKRTDVPLYKDNGYCKECWKAYMDTYRAKDPAKVHKSERETMSRYNKRMRTEALHAYGDKCACCGEINPEFLCLDHVNGDGYLERSSWGKRVTGVNIFRVAKKENYPDRYQILCYNCNQSFGHYGFCPHNTLPPRPIANKGRRVF